MFEKEYEIRVYDLNYGNHVGHDKLVSLMHDARCSFLQSGQYTELNIGNSFQGLIVSELCVKYLSQLFLNDIVKIKIFISDISHSFFKMNYIIEKENKPVANAVISLVSFNYDKNKVEKMTGDFKVFLQKFVKTLEE